MATFLTDVSSQQDTPTNPSARFQGNLITGNLVSEICTYTATATEVAADLIKVCTIPAGAMLFQDMFRVAGAALGGTTGTIASFGTTTTATELSTTTINITAASNSAVTPIAGVPGWQTPLTVNTPIYAKIGLASGNFTAGVKLYFRIVYILP